MQEKLKENAWAEYLEEYEAEQQKKLMSLIALTIVKRVNIGGQIDGKRR